MKLLPAILAAVVAGGSSYAAVRVELATLAERITGLHNASSIRNDGQDRDIRRIEGRLNEHIKVDKD